MWSDEDRSQAGSACQATVHGSWCVPGPRLWAVSCWFALLLLFVARSHEMQTPGSISSLRMCMLGRLCSVLFAVSFCNAAPTPALPHLPSPLPPALALPCVRLWPLDIACNRHRIIVSCAPPSESCCRCTQERCVPSPLPLFAGLDCTYMDFQGSLHPFARSGRRRFIAFDRAPLCMMLVEPPGMGCVE